MWISATSYELTELLVTWWFTSQRCPTEKAVMWVCLIVGRTLRNSFLQKIDRSSFISQCIWQNGCHVLFLEFCHEGSQGVKNHWSNKDARFRNDSKGFHHLTTAWKWFSILMTLRERLIVKEVSTGVEAESKYQGECKDKSYESPCSLK